ncbi:hypothetical protein KR032_002956 [Drosophila birchii]|nr:hypothetical protein KR032_002956 [Drosophila birchii]
MSNNGADIQQTDMSQEMQKSAIECAKQAIEKYYLEADIAKHIKTEFDSKFKGKWHCIVGRQFGSYVSHQPDHFIHFHAGGLAILLFKRG